MTETKFCQSCGMPMNLPGNEYEYGTEKDGGKSPDYCAYCYKDGAFVGGETTMEAMIETCVPFVVESCPGTTPEEARRQMDAFFPTLKRWKKA